MCAHPQSWFASLRRDGRAFVALAALILVFAGFHGGSVAAAAQTHLICAGDSGKTAPLKLPGRQDCLHCIGNAACGFKIFAKALPGGAILFSRPSHREVVLSFALRLLVLPHAAAQPPGSIRGPPITA